MSFSQVELSPEMQNLAGCLLSDTGDTRAHATYMLLGLLQEARTHVVKLRNECDGLQTQVQQLQAASEDGALSDRVLQAQYAGTAMGALLREHGGTDDFDVTKRAHEIANDMIMERRIRANRNSDLRERVAAAMDAQRRGENSNLPR